MYAHSLYRQLNKISGRNDVDNWGQILGPIVDANANQLLVSGTLAIKAGGSALAKTSNTIYYLSNGKLATKAASDMAALSGTVTNAKFNVFAFFIDSAGTLSSAMGGEGATIGQVVFPTIPTGKTCIGFVIINPTGTGNFVGGTTPLDDVTVVPNAAYVNTAVGLFNPLVTL